MTRGKSGNEFEMEKARQAIDGFVDYYREHVLGKPCRKVELTGRKCKNPKIIRTLLGFELQIAGKRFNCPDMPTASFLRIFALIGTGEVRVPLDPTRSEDLLPELENRIERVFSCYRRLEDGNQNTRVQSLHSLLKQKIREAAVDQEDRKMAGSA